MLVYWRVYLETQQNEGMEITKPQNLVGSFTISPWKTTSKNRKKPIKTLACPIVSPWSPREKKLVHCIISHCEIGAVCTNFAMVWGPHDNSDLFILQENLNYGSSLWNHPQEVNVGLWNFPVGLWNFPDGLCNLDCETCQSDCETCRTDCEICFVKLKIRIVKL
jgi:hypothetical protein